MANREKDLGIESVKVSDIMAREVWTVAPEASVAELIRLLSDEQISGVPVVTGSGQLRGVVSVTDVLRLAADEPAEVVEESTWEQAWDEMEQTGRDVDGTVAQSYFLDGGRDHTFMLRPGVDQLSLQPFAEHSVADIMTTATFTVRPDQSIRELASFLARGRIHRALVVEHGKLIGIVTAFDVVRAIAA